MFNIREHHQKRKKLGLCTNCGSPADGKPTRSTGKRPAKCLSCSQIFAKRWENLRTKRSQEGLCERCGKMNPRKGRKDCMTCVSNLSKRQQHNRRRKFFSKYVAHLSGINIAQMLASLWRQQKGRCPLSGRKLTSTNSELDHKIPRSKGGTDEKNNLRWLHRDVNQAKRALLDFDFIQLCRDVSRTNL
jgi:5-methylcytosine-specific restriction endonuclease McrA